ncbi:Z-ring formation inhibitor MciZ [Paenibacillus sp. MMS18-CY102]|uniref:Z-ring formation inhibitor MciZ n=1 Tax=Paenibacillus sp. MMS18-CY102 TaxID=2682849 RepID=UPI001365CDEF|nr:Z-ring formation inhibitor MciZ [Paenibacillus sp. MMS18-CY102]MWC28389.1 Z-ring formation inhibitor MciZ [Paenibacillus sp. MMS18-CY102]
MKSYYANESVRLVGKGWEIRRQLKELSTRRAPSSTAHLTLGDYLKRRCPQ